MGLIQEFKEFAVKGNAMDMAVGIILGAAFNKVVQSIVNDLIMPPIGMLIGGVDFKDLNIPLKAAELAADGSVVKPEVAIRIGTFANIVIEFLIVACSVFVIVKFMNRLIRKREAEAAKS
ncbi:MAG: large conductance mechanosensitive channel protein MscL [Phycisphaeraceae bacterium]|nr:large conductance mechanosensitive channel protein MscL [Phycisphaeraceae bacterium]